MIPAGGSTHTSENHRRVSSIGIELEQPAGLPVPIHWPSFWNRDAQERAFLIPELVPEGRSVAIYGAAKAGKSILALDAAAALATGRSIFGLKPQPSSNVLYLDMEMSEDDLHERLLAFGYGPKTSLSRLTYVLLPSLTLDSARGAKVLEGLLDRHEPKLVIVDTLGRVLEGEENSADTIRSYYRYTGAMLKRRGIASIRLDHEGKNTSRGQRGTSAKTEDVDLVWRLKRQGARIVLTRVASRVPWVKESLVLRRELTEEGTRHVLTTETRLDRSVELAAQLDDLGAAANITISQAILLLREAGTPTRREVVAEALRHRRSHQ